MRFICCWDKQDTVRQNTDKHLVCPWLPATSMCWRCSLPLLLWLELYMGSCANMFLQPCLKLHHSQFSFLYVNLKLSFQSKHEMQSNKYVWTRHIDSTVFVQFPSYCINNKNCEQIKKIINTVYDLPFDITLHFLNCQSESQSHQSIAVYHTKRQPGVVIHTN